MCHLRSLTAVYSFFFRSLGQDWGGPGNVQISQISGVHPGNPGFPGFPGFPEKSRKSRFFDIFQTSPESSESEISWHSWPKATIQETVRSCPKFCCWTRISKEITYRESDGFEVRKDPYRLTFKIVDLSKTIKMCSKWPKRRKWHFLTKMTKKCEKWNWSTNWTWTIARTRCWPDPLKFDFE